MNYEKVLLRKRSFAARRTAVKPFTTCKGPRNESRIARGTDMWEITFKIVADPRKVIVDGLWIDMMTHKNSEETQSFRSRVNGTVMEMTESKIRVGAGII